MVKKSGALGKGLSAIITSSDTPAATAEREIIREAKDAVVEVELTRIEPNPDQPRSHFDDEEVAHLAESIESVGLIQPIILRKKVNKYYIIAGERRYRAVKLLERSTIKAIVMETTDEDNLTMALIENVQRQNLDAIEEAKAYKLLITRFKLKQNEVAKKVGKDRATIANAIRLLSLPQNIQDAVSCGHISAGHAKVLCSIESSAEQVEYYDQIMTRNLSVRSLEKLISDEMETAVSGKKKKTVLSKKDAHIKEMETKLVSLLGTKVEIKHNGGKGRIEISYYSLDDFERIIEKFE
ncbi:MAG: ParB/RepB/Spo0J family partition protein [Spirochaetes bacterium]|nr:ParB/RepB/Spo0J family partition protein [Spirochaetota bacterium]